MPEPQPRHLVVHPNGFAHWGGDVFKCAIGRSGIAEAAAKIEGDGATPVGLWPMRSVLYRSDRGAVACVLPTAQLEESDGWCDDPKDQNYNRFVRHPYPASAEHLWRDDSVYDIIVTLGYNDDPVVSGRGSAIFLHLARAEYAPTEGCIALTRPDLERVLREVSAGSCVHVLAL